MEPSVFFYFLNIVNKKVRFNTMKNIDACKYMVLLFTTEKKTNCKLFDTVPLLILGTNIIGSSTHFSYQKRKQKLQSRNFQYRYGLSLADSLYSLGSKKKKYILRQHGHARGL